MNQKTELHSQSEEKNMDLETELLSRIEQMEEDSKKIKAMSRKDYIAVGVIVILCLAVVIAGAFIHQKEDPLKGMTEDNIHQKEDPLKGMTEDNIDCLWVEYYIEETDTCKEIDVDLTEKIMLVDDALCYPDGWETFIEEVMPY